MNVVSTVAPQVDETTIDLTLQLAVTAGFGVLLTVIHSLGLVAISRVLRLQDERLKQHEFNAWAIFLMARLGMLVFALHLVEIGTFAAFYYMVAGLDVEEALYYSASAYATLGRTADYFPDDWRLIGAVEALYGFILIGWSTAFMVSTMRKLSESSDG